ncbi:MAG: helix-turn-helix domain-containing protein [Flavobacteriaceae bacterium]|nr:MAG: helix-turn-helix domain-containing protein [Flavobacteriaceae bacterium]
MDFPTHFKQLRKQSGLSQAALAKKCGIKVTNISRYEMGRVKPNFDIAIKMARHLGVSMDVFYGVASTEDTQLVQLAKRASKLPKNKQQVLRQVIEAFL